MWKEKEDYLRIQIQHLLVLFNLKIPDIYYYITVKVTILYYSYTCVQYLDVQTK